LVLPGTERTSRGESKKLKRKDMRRQRMEIFSINPYKIEMILEEREDMGYIFRTHLYSF
jgi:hypothetical protein